MNHSDIQVRMADYLDGELQMGARALFDAHLDQCSECSRGLADMRSTINLLRSIPAPEPPGDLVSNVMRRIRLGEAQPTRGERFLEILSQIFTPQLAVPATALAAGLAVFLMTSDFSLQEAGRLGATGPAQVAATPVPSTILQGQSGPSAGEPSVRRSDGSGLRVVAVHPAPRGATIRSAENSLSGRYPERVAGGGPLGPMTRQRWPNDSFGSHRRFLGPVLDNSSASAQDGFGTASTPGTLQLGGGVYASKYAPKYAPSYAPNYALLEGPGALDGEDVPREIRRRNRLDAGLQALQRNPTGFAREFSATRTLAEQELWLEQLASHAVEIGQSEQVEAALRESGDVSSEQLADQFAAAAERERAGMASQTATASQIE